MRITNDDHKPALTQEALEHYGVKGMKWGVRRDQRALDRAAGRLVRKNSSKGRGEQIREARKSVKKAGRKVDKAEDRVDAAKNSKDKETAQKDFEQAIKDFENNPKRSVASQITLGEAAAIAVVSAFTLPVSAIAVTGAVAGGAAARGAAIRKQQRENS